MGHAEAVAAGPYFGAISGCSGWATARRWPASWACASCSASARLETFPARSRPSPSGSRNANGRSRPGIFNSGTNIGALVTPLIVPWITLTYGWYWAFVATGAVGFLWLIAWWLLYRRPEDHPMRGRGGTGLYPRRSRRSAGAYRLARPDPVPPDVGVCVGQVPDRSGLVALPLLDSRLPEPEPQTDADRRRAAARGDLSDRRRRQHRRRLAVVLVHRARLDDQSRAQRWRCSSARWPSRRLCSRRP